MRIAHTALQSLNFGVKIIRVRSMIESKRSDIQNTKT